MRMDNMAIMDEWLSTLLKKGTKAHHERGMRYFAEYMRMSPESIIELRKKEPNFETRIIWFYQWMQEKKGISANSARSNIISVQSFFRYVKLPIDVKRKLPDIGMRTDGHRLTPEDLIKLYKYGDLPTRAWLSLSRDCPARLGDLLGLLKRPDLGAEMTIQSEKENIPGRVYLTEGTLDLLQRTRGQLPVTHSGVTKLLQRACETAGVPVVTQHAFRKLFITTSINLGFPEIITKILSFKSVDKSLLTYYLDRSDLKASWERIINALKLEASEPNGGRIGNLEETIAVMEKAFGKFLRQMLIAEGTISRFTGNPTKMTVDWIKMTDRELIEWYSKETTEQGEG